MIEMKILSIFLLLVALFHEVYLEPVPNRRHTENLQKLCSKDFKSKIVGHAKLCMMLMRKMNKENKNKRKESHEYTTTTHRGLIPYSVTPENSFKSTTPTVRSPASEIFSLKCIPHIEKSTKSSSTTKLTATTPSSTAKTKTLNREKSVKSTKSMTTTPSTRSSAEKTTRKSTNTTTRPEKSTTQLNTKTTTEIPSSKQTTLLKTISPKANNNNNSENLSKISKKNDKKQTNNYIDQPTGKVKKHLKSIVSVSSAKPKSIPLSYNLFLITTILCYSFV